MIPHAVSMLIPALAGARAGKLPTSRRELFNLYENQCIEIPPALHGQPVTVLDVGVSGQNVLACARIDTLGDLHGLTYGHFRPLRSMGKVGAMRLREAIHAYLTDNGAPTACAEPALATHRKPVLVPPELHPIQLTALPLNGRLQKILHEHGFRTLGQLHRVQLWVYRDIGPAYLCELTAHIAQAHASQPTRTAPSP